MQNIVVFFGGKSCEHDISIITGQQTIRNLDKNRYNIIPVYINQKGEFYASESLKTMSAFPVKNYKKLTRVYFIPPSAGLYCKKAKLYSSVNAAVLAMHGLNGEDGTLQGLLELCNIPYTSCGVGASAVSMDKIAMKVFLSGLNVPIVPYRWLERSEIESEEKIEQSLNLIDKKIGFPVIVKPANLGSSIGITVCGDKEELRTAITVGFSFDNRVLIEKALTDFTEINCACMGSRRACEASECERPVSWNSFLSFEDKYMRGGKTAGLKSAGRIFPADIPVQASDKIKRTTEKVFRALDCKGVVRADYLIDNETGKIYFNELNSIPGSLAFYLWKDRGINFSGLLDRLIDTAVDEKLSKDKLLYAYRSPVLAANIAEGTKKHPLKR